MGMQRIWKLIKHTCFRFSFESLWLKEHFKIRLFIHTSFYAFCPSIYHLSIYPRTVFSFICPSTLSPFTHAVLLRQLYHAGSVDSSDAQPLSPVFSWFPGTWKKSCSVNQKEVPQPAGPQRQIFARSI